jgi:hypothetical protein
MKNTITVFFVPKKITLMFTLYPFFQSPLKKYLHFTSDLDWVLNKDRNSILLIVGWQQEWARLYGNSDIPERIRSKYDRLVFFEDNDSSESEVLHTLPLLDILLKKQVYADKSNYQKEFLGNRIYADFFKERFENIEEGKANPYPRLGSREDAGKMRLAWNLAYGYYPISKNETLLAQKLYQFFGRKTLGILPINKVIQGSLPSPAELKCQARFDGKGYGEFVGYQRNHFLQVIDKHPDFLTGRIPLKEYNNEVRAVKAMLSPFGWGEICFRDFEAIFSGAVLVKPQMGHLDTFPNVFKPNQTYLPVTWDGSDLIEKVEMLFQNHDLMEFLRGNAWNELRSAYLQMNNRVEEIFELVVE